MDWEDSEDYQELRKEDILDLNSGTRLSFENPNYFLSEVAARLNDTLNSNTAGSDPGVCAPKHRRRRSMSAEDSSSEEDEEDQDPGLAVKSDDSSEEEELEITSEALAANFPPRSSRNKVNRTRYARLNPEAMGVNLEEGPVPSVQHGGDNEPKPMETDNDDVPLQGDHSKRTPLWEAAVRSSNDDLPFGWEKRDSPGQGAYYFHTGTGISQKERPRPVIFRAPRGGVGMRRPVSMNLERLAAGDGFRRSMTSSMLADFAGCGKAANRSNSFNCDDNWKRNSLPPSTNAASSCRFMVRSLGSLEIPENELTPEKSSKAVNRCIVGLSGGTGEANKEALIGDGEDLCLDLDDSCLKLTAIDKNEVLVSQPIHTIRVWGVGRDNGRDFAYVAKNKTTRKYVCHVFRCEGPARVIANGLRDICKRIMIERNYGGGSTSSLHSSPGAKPRENSVTSSPSASVVHSGPRRPTSLAVEGSTRGASKNAQIASILQTFPTPMDEPRKVLKVVYVGSQEVSKSAGMEVLHGAIDYLTATVPMDQWIPATVAVAPSTITVCTAKDPLDPVPREQIEFECRVRFLSFLGIGKNIVYCGFIVHTAQEKFVAHIFCCEPSAATLCRTIEAACKLRYQKCMDAHGPRKTTQQQQKTANPVTTPGSNGSAKSSADSSKAGETIRSALKSMIGTIASATTKRIKSFDSS